MKMGPSIDQRWTVPIASTNRYTAPLAKKKYCYTVSGHISLVLHRLAITLSRWRLEETHLSLGRWNESDQPAGTARVILGRFLYVLHTFLEDRFKLKEPVAYPKTTHCGGKEPSGSRSNNRTFDCAQGNEKQNGTAVRSTPNSCESGSQEGSQLSFLRSLVSLAIESLEEEEVQGYLPGKNTYAKIQESNEELGSDLRSPSQKAVKCRWRSRSLCSPYL